MTIVPSLPEALPFPAVRVDADGKVREWNAGWEALSAGCPALAPPPHAGDDLRGHYAASGSAALHALARQLASSSGTVQLLHACTSPAAGTRWITSSVSRVDAGALVIHQDVTELRSADSALEAVLEQTLSETGQALLEKIVRLLAASTGARYGFLSVLEADRPGRLRTLAMTDGGQPGGPVEYAIDGSPCGDVLRERFRLIPNGVAEAYPDDAVLRDVRAQAYVGARVTREEGTALGVLGVIGDAPLRGPVDVRMFELLAGRASTELARMAAERALRESEQRLKLAIAGSHDGLFDWDVRTGRVGGSSRLHEMLGYAEGELRTIADWRQLCHPDDLPRVIAGVRAFLSGKTDRYEMELRIRAKHGGWKWILDRAGVAERDAAGKPVRVTGLHTDVSERKRLEAQLQISARMASVGTLAAGLAHEINAPLTYLRHSLEAAASAPDAARCTEALQLAREAADRVQQTVRDIRAFSHVAQEAPPARVELTAVLEQAARIARAEVIPRARFHVELGEVPAVMAHAARLAQVFVNLLINAAHAIPPGAADRNEVRLVARRDPTGRAVVEVHDTGVGIPEEHAQSIFDPFFTTKAPGEGTGLGLALSHSTIAALGGEITFERGARGGTVFRVVLPPAPEPAAEHANGKLAAPSPCPRRRVLVVDDHVTLGTSLRMLLQDEHDVIPVTTAEDALSLLTRHPGFDLVLCDLVMPGVTGMALYEQVRHANPTLASRFVFMTGGVYTAEAQEFLDTHHPTVLEKPFAPDAVREVIRTHAAQG